MKKHRAYLKLASAHQFGVTRGGWLALYLASDHLLLRRTSGFVQTYRRFYFGDIEAITIAESVRGIFQGAALGLGVFVCAIVLLMRGWHIVNAIVGGVFLLLLALHLWRGRTCRAQLQTRVQRQPLPLRRVSKALRVVALLSPKLAEAQANLPPPEVVEPTIASAASATIAASDVVPPPLPERRMSPPTALQLSMLGAFAVSGALALLDPRQPALFYLLVALVAANFGLSIAVLAQKHRWRLFGDLPHLATASLAGHVAAVPIGYVVFVVETISSLGPAGVARVPPPKQPLVGLEAFRAWPGSHGAVMVYGIFVLLLALGGLVLWLRAKRSVSRA